MTRSARPFLRRFAADQRGAVAATYALALVPLIAVAGVGMDYARLMGMDSELQNGADQAAPAAATQLDGAEDACKRASDAARDLLTNQSLLTAGNNTVTMTAASNCDGSESFKFYKKLSEIDADKDGELDHEEADKDEEARYVKVTVNVRSLNYVILPITGLFSAENISGVALAGVGSAICRVPPLMICSPSEDPKKPFDADSNVGLGIKATGGSSWAPGAFGFLEIGDGKLDDLAKALAFDEGRFDCQKIDEGTNPHTGNAQVLFEAVNTRFDIRPNGGGVLSPCDNGTCPPALNVTKDLIKTDASTSGDTCKLGNKAWELPPAAQRFRPRAYKDGDSRSGTFNASGMPLAMGLTRDMCHYNSYKRACPSVGGPLEDGRENDRFGDGIWAIQDYFARNHTGISPPRANMTRYEVYRWELDNRQLPPATNGQRSAPLCVPGSSNIDRRVLTVAIVSNCAALRGGSKKVEISEWVDMFLVEPVVDDKTERDNGRDKDMIYMEVIGEAKLGGGVGSTTSQAIRKDVPYLIE